MSNSRSFYFWTMLLISGGVTPAPAQIAAPMKIPAIRVVRRRRRGSIPLAAVTDEHVHHHLG
jgi:hypothetical protein